MDQPALAEEMTKLALMLAEESHIETFITHLLSTSLALLNADAATVFVLDYSVKHLHILATQTRSGGAVSAPPLQIPLYLAEGKANLKEPLVYALTTGLLVDLPDIYAAGGYHLERLRISDRYMGMETRSLAVLPLRGFEGRIVGALQLTNMRDGEGMITGLLPSCEQTFRALSAYAAAALSHSRIYEENQYLIKQMDRQNERLREENARLWRQIKRPAPPPRAILGDSPPIRRTIALVERAADASVPILLTGETGVGKEMMARFIHETSRRAHKSMVAQNCAALPEHLLESEIFGHVRGAFTGAVAAKDGLAHEADGGTLFLDEIGDMPLTIQAKVLRLLQDGEVRRIGATKAEYVDVRVVAATNVDLEAHMAAGLFRKDLFYRLNVFPILVPPLRERPSDIPLLIDHFLKQAATANGRPIPELSREAHEALTLWRYPGNVRELKNILERAVLLVDVGEKITPDHLPPSLRAGTPGLASEPIKLPTGDLKTILAAYEAQILEAKLREANWNQTHAARSLNISRRTMVEKLSRYGVKRPKSVRPFET